MGELPIEKTPDGFSFRIGVGYSVSIYDPQSKGFIWAEGEKKWGKKGRVGELTLKLKDCDVVRYYTGNWHYFIVQNGELRDLSYKEEEKILENYKGRDIVAKFRVITLPNGEKIEDVVVVYAKGLSIDPVFSISPESINKLKQRIDEALKLRATVWDNGITVDGDTFKLKDRLKELGFKWTGSRWALFFDEIDRSPREIVNKLKELGFEITNEKTAAEERLAAAEKRLMQLRKIKEDVARKFEDVTKVRAKEVIVRNDYAVVRTDFLGSSEFKKVSSIFKYSSDEKGFIVPLK